MADDKKKNETTGEEAVSRNFIKEIIERDLAEGKNDGRVATRFPPEPNGCLHIGHAKSIVLNFGLARDFGGACNLRFDDTNPSTEEVEYVESIQNDIRWLGYDWEDRRYFASDYFDKLYEFAVQLVKDGNAYVDSLSEEEIRKYRGDYYRKAKPSPYRDRPVEENLDLLERMRAGEFNEGEHVLRAKIDINSPNMNMRDPIVYRIRKVPHHRTGDKWKIYPMYDFAHGLSDSIEGITHSICTLEFEDHRPLYDWFLDVLPVPSRPHQYEFARGNVSYTVLSKRKLLQLVKEGLVRGWDDPRMPTLAGFRRRGYTPRSIRNFWQRVGVAKADNTVDIGLLEHSLREDLNESAPRVMGVLRPLKVVITNFPEDQAEEFNAPWHPEDQSQGSRKLPFCRELWVERDDFREDPPRKWHRLAPGSEVRLRYACLITCNEVVKDTNGDVVELRCTWDPESRGGKSPDGRKVRGTLHWVSAHHAVDAEVRKYDRLFTVPNPNDVEEGKTFKDYLNPDSLEVLKGCKLEPEMAKVEPGAHVQFERLGYYCADNADSKPGAPVFNLTVTLRDSWAKIEKKEQQEQTEPGKKPARAKSDGATGKGEITYDDFAKLDLRVGVIREASLVEGADKLLRLMVDLGEGRLRQIFAGIRASYDKPEELVGKRVTVLANIKPRKMKFGISEGMVLTGGDDDKSLSVTTFDGDLKPGEGVN